MGKMDVLLSFGLVPSIAHWHPVRMLTELYIDALLVDEDLANEVYEAWDKGRIDDGVAWLAWWMIT